TAPLTLSLHDALPISDIGLNATMGATRARSGRLALIAQSGSMCTAMLEFATSVGIGFSSVVSLGGGVDIGFGEVLDALLLDSERSEEHTSELQSRSDL